MRPTVYNGTTVNAQCQDYFDTYATVCTKKTNDYVIMLKTHNERALHINAGGKVTAADISLAQFFTMDSVGDLSDFLNGTLKITLFSKEVGRYLCFRKGRLVGLKTLTKDCHFKESLEYGYFLYTNAYNQTLRVGFTKGFKPVGPRHLSRPQSLQKACFLFEKIEAEHFDRAFFTTSTTSTTTSRTTTKKTTSTSTTTSTTTTTTTQSPLTSSRSQKLNNKIETTSINNHNDSPRNDKTVKFDAIETPKHTNQNNHIHEIWHSANGDIVFHDNDDDNKNNSKNNNQTVDRPGVNNSHKSRVHSSKHHNNNNANRKLRQQQRRRKQQRKSMMAERRPQPKNLVRHHHDNSTLIERRQKHVREQKVRKSRRKHHQHQQRAVDEEYDAKKTQTASSSSSATAAAASALTTTATLAPSAFNIVAMAMAASRKRGRRKKDTAASSSNANVNMDMQIVAQTTTPKTSGITATVATMPLKSIVIASDRLYDEVQRDTITHPHGHHRHLQQQLNGERKNNYYQQEPPVNIKSNHPNAFDGNQHHQRQQQQTEYSNSNLMNNFNLNNNAIPALPKNYLYNKATTNVNLIKDSRSTDYSRNSKFRSHHQQHHEPRQLKSHSSSNKAYVVHSRVNKQLRDKRSVPSDSRGTDDEDETTALQNDEVEGSSSAPIIHNDYGNHNHNSNDNANDNNNVDNNFKRNLLTRIYRNRIQQYNINNDNNNKNYININDINRQRIERDQQQRKQQRKQYQQRSRNTIQNIHQNTKANLINPVNISVNINNKNRNANDNDNDNDNDDEDRNKGKNDNASIYHDSDNASAIADNANAANRQAYNDRAFNLPNSNVNANNFNEINVNENVNGNGNGNEKGKGNGNENLLASYRKHFFRSLMNNDDANQKNFHYIDEKNEEIRMNMNKYEKVIVQYRFAVFTWKLFDFISSKIGGTCSS